MVALRVAEIRNEAFWVWKGRNSCLRDVVHKSLMDLGSGNCLSLSLPGKGYDCPYFTGAERLWSFLGSLFPYPSLL